MKKIPGPGFSITLRIQYATGFDGVGIIAQAVAAAEALVDSAVGVPGYPGMRVTDVCVFCRDLAQQKEVLAKAKAMKDIQVMQVVDDTYAVHNGGKVRIAGADPLVDLDDLSRQYTPGVGRICRSIANDKERSFVLTQRKNMVAVVSDGSAILGLGNLGPEAALPVMEGKALLFKEFAGVDAFPIVLATQEVDEVVETVVRLAPTFGGINLEDISAPRCFEIESKLKERLSIPVFHDDQHGTAVVALAALQNACEVIGKKLPDLKMVIMGVGAAGTACAKLFLAAGVKDIVGVNRSGVLYDGKPGLNSSQQAFAAMTNPNKEQGTLADVIKGADVFVGLSGPDTVKANNIKLMGKNAIVFAMSNPDPEISPEDALPYVAIMATGRSDYPNQVNNVLAFPGIFRGALDAAATAITPAMNLAASQAIASIAKLDGLRHDYILPRSTDRRVAAAVAEAVKQAAIREGVSQKRPAMPGIGELADA